MAEDFDHDYVDEDHNPEDLVAPPGPIKSPLISSRFYDALKFIVTIAMPALTTLYLVLAGLWGLPEPERVAATSAAVATCLGVLLRMSTKSYDNSDKKFDGAVNITEPLGDGRKLIQLDVTDNPEAWAKQEHITLRVNNQGNV